MADGHTFLTIRRAQFNSGKIGCSVNGSELSDTDEVGFVPLTNSKICQVSPSHLFGDAVASVCALSDSSGLALFGLAEIARGSLPPTSSYFFKDRQNVIMEYLL